MNRELQNMSEESLQNLEEIVETELLTVEDIRERLDTTEKGKIRQSIQNCKYALEHDPCLKGAICRNEMTCQIDIRKKMPWKRRGVHMTDTDMNNLALYLEKNYGLTSDRVIAKAIDIVANENSFHPILQYLESLKWDGIPRIQHMLTHFFGAEDIAYTGEVMKMHMMGAIRRLYEPGAKYDIMLCLVGGQGTGKSTFFRYLAIKDEWFTDDMKRIDDKKVYEYLQGHWIVEMSEMNAVANAKSIEETKSFLSRQKDIYRIPYERRAEDRYRQCALKGVMQATIRASQTDINEFLKTAGINYELVILAEDETNSRTILKQCFSEKKTAVTKIRDHLSWGEKNAFALILFMYYAVMQDPDLIILDDPISSFDTNKKFAILHRMFKNIGKRDISLEGKTVLFLTHDFEPITDFIVVGKLGEEKAQASFICNEHGIVRAHKIDPNSDVKLITTECSEIAKNTDINIVSRVAFLRKLSELNGRNGEWDLVYEILSCLIHASEIKRKVGNTTYIDIDPEDIALGISKIKEYIPDFDYDELKNNIYTKEGIKNLYGIETNAYLKIQLFREMNEILTHNEVKITQMDNAWYKYIDETYHIENDYLHFLDIIKFNIVPSYIIDNVDEIVSGI